MGFSSLKKLNFACVVATPTNLQTSHIRLEEESFENYSLKLTSSNENDVWNCPASDIKQTHIDMLIESRKKNLKKEIQAIEKAYRQHLQKLR